MNPVLAELTKSDKFNEYLERIKKSNAPISILGLAGVGASQLVASTEENIKNSSKLTESTRDTADTAASPTDATIMESAIPTIIERSCSIIRGKISFLKSEFLKISSSLFMLFAGDNIKYPYPSVEKITTNLFNYTLLSA